MKKEILKYIEFLKAKGVSNPVIEIERYISEAFNIPFYRVVAFDLEFTKEIEEGIKDFCNKRAEGIPYAYILGFTHFWGRKFMVTPDVLIPRPETEIIVDFVLKKVGKGFNGKLLDCCTGSGNLAVTFAAEMPNANVFASDYSLKALNIAYKNAENIKVEVGFFQCDKLACLKEEAFDIVVANPPYIGLKEKDMLEKEVLNEPHLALFGGENGYEFFEKFLIQAKNVLKEKGIIVFEIGYNQRDDIESLVLKLLGNVNLYFLKDLNGYFRVGVIEYA